MVVLQRLSDPPDVLPREPRLPEGLDWREVEDLPPIDDTGSILTREPKEDR